MNRDDGVFFLVGVFFQLEEMINAPTKYLDFCVTLKNSEEADKKINILSFKFEEDTKTRVFLFPSDYDGVAILNSRAVLYHNDKFFRVRGDKDITTAITSIFPDIFDVRDLDLSFEIRSIELNEFSKYVLAVDKIKKKFK